MPDLGKLAAISLALTAANCGNPMSEESWDENPFSIGSQPQPAELEQYYEREAIIIVRCLVREGARCQNPSISDTTIDAHPTSDIAGGGRLLDTDMMDRLSRDYGAYSYFVVSDSTAFIPAPYVRMDFPSRPISPELLTETRVDVTLDLANSIEESGMRLVLSFREGKLANINDATLDPTRGMLSE